LITALNLGWVFLQSPILSRKMLANTVVCGLLFLPFAAAVQMESNVTIAEDGSESLGNKLLDDLTPSAPQKPASVRPDPPASSKRRGSSRRAVPRFEDFGEDIGKPSGPLPLMRVRQEMQRAASLLGQSSASRSAEPLNQAAGVQEQVVDQLDELIAELSKKCQGGQFPPGSQPPSPSNQSQAKPGNSQGAAAQGRTAARDSSDRLENAGAKPVEKGDIEELARELWGHLPQRKREQMLQSFSEEFLPKYERDIEQYYRRLSEEQKAESARQ
jgi:hypothetical protein